jgi:hypothetical protein
VSWKGDQPPEGGEGGEEEEAAAADGDRCGGLPTKNVTVPLRSALWKPVYSVWGRARARGRRRARRRRGMVFWPLKLLLRM